MEEKILGLEDIPNQLAELEKGNYFFNYYSDILLKLILIINY